MNGEISLTEYQNALECYGISEEPHFDADDSSEKYTSFDQRAIFKLLEILNGRQMKMSDQGF